VIEAGPSFPSKRFHGLPQPLRRQPRQLPHPSFLSAFVFRHDDQEAFRPVRRLEEGDVMVVTRLDRLARSTRDLLNVLDEISKRGAGFKSLKDSWADTTTPHGAFDAHGARRSRRVRARIDPRAHR
jgi:resolvase-like protein